MAPPSSSRSSTAVPAKPSSSKGKGKKEDYLVLLVGQYDSFYLFSSVPGSTKVGKTSLLQRYLTGKIDPNYSATKFDIQSADSIPH